MSQLPKEKKKKGKELLKEDLINDIGTWNFTGTSTSDFRDGHYRCNDVDIEIEFAPHPYLGRALKKALPDFVISFIQTISNKINNEPFHGQSTRHSNEVKIDEQIKSSRSSGDFEVVFGIPRKDVVAAYIITNDLGKPLAIWHVDVPPLAMHPCYNIFSEEDFFVFTSEQSKKETGDPGTLGHVSKPGILLDKPKLPHAKGIVTKNNPFYEILKWNKLFKKRDTKATKAEKIEHSRLYAEARQHLYNQQDGVLHYKFETCAIAISRTTKKFMLLSSICWQIKGTRFQEGMAPLIDLTRGFGQPSKIFFHTMKAWNDAVPECGKFLFDINNQLSAEELARVGIDVKKFGETDTRDFDEKTQN